VRRRSIAAGLAFGGSGTLVGLAIVGGFGGLAPPAGNATDAVGTLVAAFGLPLAAGLGAAVAGTSLRWLVVEAPNEPTLLRGAIVGTAVGVAAHPLMWMLYGVGMGAVVLGPDGPAALADVALGNVASLAGVFVLFTVLGLPITGIVTVPVAAGTGVVLAQVREKAADADRRPGERRPRHL
jgi:hypothetical protein